MKFGWAVVEVDRRNAMGYMVFGPLRNWETAYDIAQRQGYFYTDKRFYPTPWDFDGQQYAVQWEE